MQSSYGHRSQHPSRRDHRIAGWPRRLNGNHGPGELARRTPTRIDGRVRAPYAGCPDPADRRDAQHCHSGPIESPPDLNIWGAQLRWPGELPPLMHKSLISWSQGVSSVSGNGSGYGRSDLYRQGASKDAGMGVAGVGDPLVPAADMLQMRRRACERAGSRAGSWRRCSRLSAGRLRPCQTFMQLGVRRATDSYRISRHLQAAAQTISKTVTLPTAAQCALPRSLA
jgi:hypothetical protein